MGKTQNMEDLKFPLKFKNLKFFCFKVYAKKKFQVSRQKKEEHEWNESSEIKSRKSNSKDSQKSISKRHTSKSKNPLINFPLCFFLG